MSKRKLLIFTGVVLFLLQPVLLPAFPMDSSEPHYFKDLSENILGNLLILIFFYINYTYLIPGLLFQKKYLQYGFLVFLGLMVVLLLPWALFGSHAPPDFAQLPFHPRTREKTMFHRIQLFFSEVDHLVFLFVGTIFFSTFWFERMQNQKIKNEKLQAELSHLKLQIHPHFLFNTLNSIYAFAIKKDDKTADTVLVFSDFMRYLLQDSYQNEVLLEKEVQYISNYIELQKSRLRNSVAVEFEKTGDFDNKKIAPLILFTFVENAFKYGVNPDENSEIKIEISIQENELNFMVFNRVVSAKNIESSNIGIKNTKERLMLYYPQKHTLEIKEGQKAFIVNLKINLL
ncbi:sensor histidine kinase [Chryseobacterium sp.]|uniref:sensor histidine kinase n=1 Tax=Chryseobacterium sp. TaxID=1871047 RepID=UPI0035C6C131